jgi:hypothetical protein
MIIVNDYNMECIFELVIKKPIKTFKCVFLHNKLAANAF